MKSFKEKLSELEETVNPPKSEDEQRFMDKHVVDKKKHPVAKEDQFTSKAKKAKREADLTDGEDEEVYEEKMSDAQMTKREKIVKSMKKKMDDFKDRYGDDAKDVMYATATKMAMKEEVDLSEDVMADLKKIVKSKSAGDVKFADGSKLKVDMFTASAMTKVHDALNGANQKKFADAINKNENMFMKMMDFAMSKVK